MSAISSVVSDVLPAVSDIVPVFNAANTYMAREDRLQAAADRAAAKAAATQKARKNLQATQELQMQQLQQSQATDTAIQDANLQTQMDQTQLAANDTEQTRRDALRSAVAKTTTSLAGQGIDPHDGSGEAILLGQIKASDQARQAADAATQLRMQALSQQAADINQRNLLEQTQLADRQHLQWLNSFS